MAKTAQEAIAESAKKQEQEAQNMAKSAARVGAQDSKTLPAAPVQADAAKQSNAQLQAGNKAVEETVANKPVNPQPAMGPVSTPVIQTAGNLSETKEEAIKRKAMENNQRLEQQAKEAGAINYGEANVSAANRHGTEQPKYFGAAGTNNQKPTVAAGDSKPVGQPALNTTFTPGNTKEVEKVVQNTAKEVGAKIDPGTLKKIVSGIAGIVDAYAKGRSFSAGNFDYKTQNELQLAKDREVTGNIAQQKGYNQSEVEKQKALVPIKGEEAEKVATAQNEARADADIRIEVETLETRKKLLEAQFEASGRKDINVGRALADVNARLAAISNPNFTAAAANELGRETRGGSSNVSGQSLPNSSNASSRINALLGAPKSGEDKQNDVMRQNLHNVVKSLTSEGTESSRQVTR